MKHLIALLSVLILGNAFAQTDIALHLDNPAPRVGDKVGITISHDFLTQAISSQLGEGISLTNKYNPVTNTSGEFKWHVKFEKIGNQAIGPFVFLLNGHEFKTDSLVVNVKEKLEWKADVWVRHEHVSGSHYIIIEQLLDEKNEGKYTLVELNEKLVEGISSQMEYSSTQSPAFEEGKVDGTKMRYAVHRYRLDIDQTSQSPITLTNKNFKHLPKGKVVELKIAG